MIVSHINLLDAEKNLLPKGLIKGLEYLKSTDFSKLEIGKIELDGTSLFALVQEYQTQPKDAKKAEVHVKYIDVQFVYSGEETIGFSPADPAAEILEDLADKKDMIYYKTVPNETDVILTPGMYAVLFPGEIHRPQCTYKAETKVRKVVLKVAMEYLNAPRA